MGTGEPSPRRFPSTHWSIIESAEREDVQGRRPALADLVTRYLPALRAHLLARRLIEPSQLDDILQGFISSKMLEGDLIARADRMRGKFRTLLLTALDRFVISRRRYDHAAKRGTGRTESLSDDGADAAGAWGARKPDAFDVEWARQILRQALERMRRQCETDGRLDVWGVFECRVLKPALEGAPPPDYQQIVQRFSARSPTQVWNAVRTGKMLFARVLRSVVAEYAVDEQEVEAELADLRAICARLPPQDGSTNAYPPSGDRGALSEPEESDHAD